MRTIGRPKTVQTTCRSPLSSAAYTRATTVSRGRHALQTTRRFPYRPNDRSFPLTRTTTHTMPKNTLFRLVRWTTGSSVPFFPILVYVFNGMTCRLPLSPAAYTQATTVSRGRHALQTTRHFPYLPKDRSFLLTRTTAHTHPTAHNLFLPFRRSVVRLPFFQIFIFIFKSLFHLIKSIQIMFKLY